MNRIRIINQIYFFIFFKNVRKNKSWNMPIRCRNVLPAIGLISIFSKKNQNFVEVNVTKIIEQADNLFDEEKYAEVYDFLLQYKDVNNIDIQWRICRALYKMSRSEIYTKTAKEIMLLEAYDLIRDCQIENNKNGDFHKWTAILLDAKLRLDSSFAQVDKILEIKNHLMEANRLKPDDYTVLYMLGQWHYKICSLSWIQKVFLSFIYPEITNCNYEEALNYFTQAEEVKPRYFLSNIFMLGKINFHLGKMYRAHYYLSIAAHMTPNTDQEEEYVKSAQNLITKLKDYRVNDDVL